MSLTEDGRIKVRLTENGFDEASLSELKSLLSTNGLYRIRMRSQANNATSPYVMAAIPSCDLQKSGFKEDIVLHLDLAERCPKAEAKLTPLYDSLPTP